MKKKQESIRSKNRQIEKKKHKLINAFTKIQNDFDEIKNVNNAKQISIDNLNKEIDDFFRKNEKQLIKQTFTIK